MPPLMEARKRHPDLQHEGAGFSGACREWQRKEGCMQMSMIIVGKVQMARFELNFDRLVQGNDGHCMAVPKNVTHPQTLLTSEK